MPLYRITTTQEFDVTYEIEGDDEHDAWERLMDNEESECLAQMPERMVGEFHKATIEEV